MRVLVLTLLALWCVIVFAGLIWLAVWAYEALVAVAVSVTFLHTVFTLD